jgi:hypothetical protein
VITRNETLVVPQPIFQRLHGHLFPGDGLEAAALLLCVRVTGRRRKLLACDLIAVPYEACVRRTENFLSWPGSYVEKAIERAEAAGLSILAVHSHPGGLFAFSDLDAASDELLLPALFHGMDAVAGSAIMLPDGAKRGRLYGADKITRPIDLISMIGDDLRFWWQQDVRAGTSPKRPVAFTSGMTEWLGRLSVCIIGLSGTGSVVAEQLARLGFGEIIVIDFDRIELRNLNRILNATIADAKAGRLKVEMFASAVRHYRAGCDVQCVPSSIATSDAVLAACEADILFSCVDTAEGRHIADRLAAYCAMPLIDLGVSIPTRRGWGDEREIAEVCGRIDYVFPGGQRSSTAAYTMPPCWKPSTSPAPRLTRTGKSLPMDTFAVSRNRRLLLLPSTCAPPPMRSWNLSRGPSPSDMRRAAAVRARSSCSPTATPMCWQRAISCLQAVIPLQWDCMSHSSDCPPSVSNGGPHEAEDRVVAAPAGRCRTAAETANGRR